MKKIFFSLLFLICIFNLLSCDYTKDEDKQNTKYNPTTEPKEVILFDETVNISAGSYMAYPMYCSYLSTLYISIKLTNENLDINEWFMSEDEYEHFKANETFKYFPAYSREKVVEFSFEYKPLVTGYYYLVLDNRYSWFTSKAVSIEVIRSDPGF